MASGFLNNNNAEGADAFAGVPQYQGYNQDQGYAHNQGYGQDQGYMQNQGFNDGGMPNDTFAPMMAQQAPTEEPGLYKVPKESVRLVNFALSPGVNVEMDPLSHEVQIKAKGMLTKERIMHPDGADCFVIAADEKNITKTLKRPTNRQIYSLALGIGWKNGERCSAVYIPGCIMEYQKKSAKEELPSVDGGRQNGRYLYEYVRFGIPKFFYNWIVDSCADINLLVGPGGKETMDKEDDGYCWLTVTISDESKVFVMVRMPGQKNLRATKGPGHLRTLMDGVGKGLTCNTMFKMSAKRPEDYSIYKPERKLGFALLGLQMTGTTSRQSQPLNPVSGFEGTGEEASADLVALINRMGVQQQHQQMQGQPQGQRQGQAVMTGSSGSAPPSAAHMRAAAERARLAGMAAATGSSSVRAGGQVGASAVPANPSGDPNL